MDIDTLAVIIKKGFDSVDTRFDVVDARFDGIDSRLDDIDSRIDSMEGLLGKVENEMIDMSARLRSVERNVEYIHDHMVFQEGFEDLTARVKYLETKMGIDSGK